jgi:hypothetical protein
MKTPSEVEEVWSQLESLGPVVHREYRVREAGAAAGGEVSLLGLDSACRRHLLIPCRQGETVVADTSPT